MKPIILDAPTYPTLLCRYILRHLTLLYSTNINLTNITPEFCLKGHIYHKLRLTAVRQGLIAPLENRYTLEVFTFPYRILKYRDVKSGLNQASIKGPIEKLRLIIILLQIDFTICIKNRVDHQGISKLPCRTYLHAPQGPEECTREDNVVASMDMIWSSCRRGSISSPHEHV